MRTDDSYDGAAQKKASPIPTEDEPQNGAFVMTSTPQKSATHPVRNAARELTLTFVTTLILFIWFTLASGQFEGSALATSFAIASLITVCGSAGARVLPLPDVLSRDLNALFLVGAVVSSGALFILRFLLPLSLAQDALLLFFLALAGCFRKHGRSPASEMDFSELLNFVLIAGAATLWSREVLQPPRVLPDWIEFDMWRDYFIHASVVGRLARPGSLWTDGSISFSNQPIALYHYGSYLLPALAKAFSALPTLDVTRALLAPLGTMLAGIAAYLCGCAWGGRAAGTAAAAFLLLLPDPSNYWLRADWFGFSWLTQISPSLSFGIAVAALALILLTEGCRSGDRVRVLCGIGLTGLVALFKAQLFLAALPVFIIAIPCCYRGLSLKARAAGIAAAAATITLGMCLLGLIAKAPTLRLDPAGGVAYAKLIYLQIPASRMFELLKPASFQGPDFYFYQTAILVLATLGALIFGYLVFWAAVLLQAKNKRPRVHPEDLVPGLVLIQYLGFSLFLGENISTPDPFELHHRTLVWAYFIFSVWSGAALIRFLGRRRHAQTALALAGCLLFSVPCVLGAAVERGNFKWSGTFVPVKVPAGLISAAQFLRDKADATDVIQDSELDQNMIVNSIAERSEFASLVFLSRQFLGSVAPETIDARVTAIRSLLTNPDSQAPGEFYRTYGVRWLLIRPETPLLWPSSTAGQYVFEAGGYRVYDLKAPGL